jgi:transcriptional regulator with XRE-family HTH domain
MEDLSSATFGDLLRVFREKRGYSQRSLARLARLDSTYLSRLERGAVPPPKVPTVHRIAEALGADEDEEVALIEACGRLPRSMAVIPRATKEAQAEAALSGWGEWDHTARDPVGVAYQHARSALTLHFGDAAEGRDDDCAILIRRGVLEGTLSVHSWNDSVRFHLAIPIVRAAEVSDVDARRLLRRNEETLFGCFVLMAEGDLAFADSLAGSPPSEVLTAWIMDVLAAAEQQYTGDSA